MVFSKVVSSVAGTIGDSYAIMVEHASFVSGFVSGATMAGMSAGVGPKLTLTAAGITEDSLAATENTIGAYQDVASHVTQKLHMNVDELDLTLEAVSSARRVSHNPQRPQDSRLRQLAWVQQGRRFRPRHGGRGRWPSKGCRLAQGGR